MPTTTHARSAALAKVCRAMLAAEAQGQISVPVAELRVALDGVDVEGLAVPRRIELVCNVGGQAVARS